MPFPFWLITLCCSLYTPRCEVDNNNDYYFYEMWTKHTTHIQQSTRKILIEKLNFTVNTSDKFSSVQCMQYIDSTQPYSHPFSILIWHSTDTFLWWECLCCCSLLLCDVYFIILNFSQTRMISDVFIKWCQNNCI